MIPVLVSSKGNARQRPRALSLGQVVPFVQEITCALIDAHGKQAS